MTIKDHNKYFLNQNLEKDQKRENSKFPDGWQGPVIFAEQQP